MEYQRNPSKLGKFQKKKTGIIGKLMLFFLAALISVLLLSIRITDETEVAFLEAETRLGSIQQNRLLSSQESESGANSSRKDHQIVRWLQASKAISVLKRGQAGGLLRIGLLNISNPDTELWKSFSGGNEPIILDDVLDVNNGGYNMSWTDFFPLDVDRDEDVQAARCPTMRLPEVRPVQLDLVVTSLSCENDGAGSRDVRYLRSSLSIGQVVASTKSDFIHVLLQGPCRPMPNIFKCNELLDRSSGIYRLYKLNTERMRRLFKLPVGSCRAIAPSTLPATKVDDKQRQVYATIIHSVNAYVCGAIMLAHSIRKTGSTRDLVLLVDKNIKPADKRGLEAAGWKVRYTERIRNPKARNKAYNQWNYSKFRLWQLIDYDKVVFVDSDVIVARNMDFLFSLPEVSAARNHDNVFNSGVMVVEPSLCTFDYLLDNMDKIMSYNGGDQGYLNEVFTWWHRLPLTMNFLKFFDDDVKENKRKVKLLTEVGNNTTVYAKHYLGLKPWLCYRHQDCNWYDTKYLKYANDEVHAHWWELHDEMPPELQGFCKLSKSRQARLERQYARAHGHGHKKREIRR